MYRIINDFLEDWAYESEATLKIFTNLKDESLDQKVYEGGRSLRIIAWHITLSIPEMLNHAGFTDFKLGEFNPPQRLSDIIAEYKKNSELLVNFVKSNWKDDDLLTEINIYGENWKIGKFLSVLVVHQIHHRAQMTVLMRQAGLMVPGIYGPSKEEWAAANMPPQL